MKITPHPPREKKGKMLINQQKPVFNTECEEEVDNIEVTENGASQAVGGLKDHPASGPDEIPAVLIKKKTKMAFVKPMMLLMRKKKIFKSSVAKFRQCPTKENL